jgi:hypothetical protein
MAKKYGHGATEGLKASKFQATAPDGTILIKKSFFIHTDTAFIGAFKGKDGKWMASGVTNEPKSWGEQVFLVASRK